MARLIIIIPDSLLLAYFIFFLYSSFIEKEERAVLAALILVVCLLAGGITVFFLPNSPLYWPLTLFFLFLLGLLFLPFGVRSKTEIIGERTRHDERDIMFARARYVAGSDAYQDYYRRHPQKKKTDDALRALPDLLAPGGEHYEAVGAKIAENNFKLNEKLIPLCVGEPAADKVDIPAKEASAVLKKLCLSLGAVDAGVAPLDLHHLYSHVGRGPGGYGTPITGEFENVIVFAVEMDFAAMQQAPKMPVIVESSKQYFEAATIAVNVASFIRSLGCNARAHIDANYRFMLPAAAADAGLGEVGRIGYLIHPKFGARTRLGAVTTDMPLAYDSRITFGVQNFCRICKKCATYCPSGAISFGAEKEVRGVGKWSTNQEACYRYWRTVGADCGICMKVCPYSKPANFAHNVIRTMIRQNPAARKLAVIGDKIIYKYQMNAKS